jgi:hypothetical protein
LQFAYTDSAAYERYWLNGNIYYADASGGKYKTPLSLADALPQLSATFEADGLINILNTVGIDFEGGNTVYYYTYTADEHNDVAAAILGDNYLTEFPELTVNDIRSEIHISPSGQLKKQFTMIRGEYTSNGGRIVLQAVEDMTINAIGSNVRVAFPGDLSSYELAE